MALITKTSSQSIPIIQLGNWRMPSFDITLRASNTLQAMVRSIDTDFTYTTEVKAPFIISQISRIQLAIQDHFYPRVILSNQIPVSIEFSVRGVGGGFYSQTSIPLPPIPQGTASLSQVPKTLHELVWVLRQLKTNDARWHPYLSAASEFIKEFAHNPTHTKEQIDGLIMLILIDEKNITRTVINQLIGLIKDNTLLNVDLIHGLASAIDRASPAHLNPDDFVQLTTVLIERMKITHIPGTEAIFEDQLKALVRILNAMVDANVYDIPRQKHEEIKQFLSDCAKSDSIGIKSFAAYAKQAFARIPNDESKFAAFLRYSMGAAKGIYHFYAAFNQLDPGQIVKGFFSLQETASAVFSFAKQIASQVQNALPDFQAAYSQDIRLKPRKLDWYDQIRYVEFLISSNCFRALEQLLLDSRVQKKSHFMYLLIIKLNEVILTHPSMVIRKETLLLQQNIYQDDKNWGELVLTDKHYKNEGPKALELGKKKKIQHRLYLKGMILSNFQSYVQIPVLSSEASKILNLITEKAGSTAESKFMQKYRSQESANTAIISVSASSSPTKLFEANTQEQFKLESKLAKIKASIVDDEEFLKEQKTYIPPMGAAAAGASSSYDLLQEIHSFLKGNQLVLLLMGDSGSGKSLLSQTLAYQLWQTYQPISGVIPLYVSLPTLKDPVNSLISQAAKRLGLTLEEIHEIQDKREVIFILDGYDEIPKDSDIIEGNQLLNFKGKIIVTCRTEAIPSPDLFVPVIGGKPKRTLLRELYIAPFSITQIDQFIQKCIDIGDTEWKQVALYSEQLERIQGLKDLVQNPFILKIITDTLPEIIAQAMQDKKDQITLRRYALYQAFIDEWLQKGFTRAKKQFTELKTVGLTPNNLKIEAIKFCIQLANTFQAKGMTHVQHEMALDDPALEPFFKEDLRTSTLRSMAPLKISKEGACYFLHKSLMEYFIALGAKNCVTQSKTEEPPISINRIPSDASIPIPAVDAPSPKRLIKGVPLFDSLLEPSVWSFLADTAKEDFAFKHELFSLIEQSKTDPQFAIAAANAITILNLANVSFSKRNLRGIRIPGANLEKAILIEADLRDSNLSKVNLSQAILSDALLDNALMVGVEFGQLPMIQTQKQVPAVLSSLDGKLLIGAVGNDIVVWDYATGKEIKTLEGHTSEVTTLALLSGELFASGSNDNTIRIWNLTTGEIVKVFRANTHRVTALTSCSAGEIIASGSNVDFIIRIWDYKAVDTFKAIQGHTGFINALVSLPGGLLASGSDDNTVRIWDLNTYDSLFIFKGHTKPVRTLAILAEREFLASGSDDNTVRIWNIKTGEAYKTLQGHTSRVTALAFLYGGEFLASGSLDGSIRIWNLKTSETFKILYGHNDSIDTLAILGEGTFLVSGSRDGTIRIWNLKTETILKIYKGHFEPISALSFFQDEDIFASGSLNSICTWDTKTGEIIDRFPTKKGDIIFALALLKGGETVASASIIGGENWQDDSISIWNSKTGKIIKTLKHDGALALTPLNGGQLLASWRGSDWTVRIWDVKKGENIKTLQESKGIISSFIVLQGEEFAAGSSSDTIYIWDLKKGKLIKILHEKYKQRIQSLASLKGGEFLASNDGQSVHIWDLKKEKIVKKLEFTSGMNNFVSIKNGEFLATSDGKTIQIWDFETEKEVLSLSNPFAIFSSDVKKVKEVFTIPHPFDIRVLTFKEPNLLYIGDSNGGIWCWKLITHGKAFQLDLLWTTQPVLISRNVRIGNVLGLSPANERLMLQHGAIE